MTKKMTLKLFLDYLKHPIQTLYLIVAVVFLILAVRKAMEL